MHEKCIAARIKGLLRVLATCMCVGAIAPSFGASFSFVGGLPVDNAIQPFEFEVSNAGLVELRTWSYAGGTNASGTIVLRGGFDPILSVFDSTGGLIEVNDDSGLVADPVSGAAWDSLLSLNLAPGLYTATITQYSNFPRGSSFSDGFDQDANPNFNLGFDGRSSHWALDIVNVDSASALAVLTPAIPEPDIVVLFLAGLGLIVAANRRRSGR